MTHRTMSKRSYHGATFRSSINILKLNGNHSDRDGEIKGLELCVFNCSFPADITSLRLPDLQIFYNLKKIHLPVTFSKLYCNFSYFVARV